MKNLAEVLCMVPARKLFRMLPDVMHFNHEQELNLIPIVLFGYIQYT